MLLLKTLILVEFKAVAIKLNDLLITNIIFSGKIK